MKRVLLLEKCPDGKITKENWFVYLLSDIEIKNKYSNQIFFLINDGIVNECLFVQDYEENVFWINYDYIRPILTKLNLPKIEVRNFIKCAVEKHFKISISP